MSKITSQIADVQEVTHAPQIIHRNCTSSESKWKRQSAQKEEDVSAYGGSEKSKDKDTAQKTNVKFYENFNL